MRAEKIAISLSKDEHGKYNVQVLGINADRVISSVSDLEELGVSLSTAVRAVERVFHIIRLRLSRKELEFVVKEKDNDNEMGRTGV